MLTLPRLLTTTLTTTTTTQQQQQQQQQKQPRQQQSNNNNDNDDNAAEDANAAVADTNNATPAAPDAVATASVGKIFADGGGISSPCVPAALASLVDASLFRFCQKFQLFPAPANRPLSAASPSIHRHITNAASSIAPPFCSSLDFFNSQLLFNAVFPPLDQNSIFTLQPNLSSTAVDADDITAKAVQIHRSKCRMLVFKSVIYFSASVDHLQVTVKRLRNLTLKFKLRGVNVDGNPNMLFDKHILALTPLPPVTHVNVWGINLFTQSWHDLGKILTHQSALLPCCLDILASEFDLTTMTAKDRQMSALQELRSLAVKIGMPSKTTRKACVFHKLSASGHASNDFIKSSANVLRHSRPSHCQQC